MKKRLTIQQLQIATGGKPESELKTLTLTITGVVKNRDGIGQEFGVFFERLAALLAETFPDFVPDSPGAQLDVDDLEVVE